MYYWCLRLFSAQCFHALIQTVLWILIVLLRFHFANWFHRIEVGENLEYKLCTWKEIFYIYICFSLGIEILRFIHEWFEALPLCLGEWIVKFNFLNIYFWSLWEKRILLFVLYEIIKWMVDISTRKNLLAFIVFVYKWWEVKYLELR